MLMPPPVPKSTDDGDSDAAYRMPNSLLNFDDPSISAVPPSAASLESFDMIDVDNMEGGGLGDLGASLFEYDNGDDDGIDLAGLRMDNYPAYGEGEVYAGFEMGMMGEDFTPVGVGIPSQEMQFAPPRGVRSKKKTSSAKGEGKPRSKKAKAPKVILMHEDGTTPNWDERLKKSMKPRRERKPPVGGKWSDEEDAKLKHIVETHGAKNWKGIAELLGTLRNDVQCLHRWNKVLKPGLHKGPWTEEEDSIVRYMVMEHGVGMVKWSVIASQLQGR